MASLRRYRGRIRVTYLGGTLPIDAYESLASAMPDASCTVSSDAYDALIVTAVVRAATPRDALADLDAALDRALLTTGLFEEFDVTGKVLYAGPAELAGGE